MSRMVRPLPVGVFSSPKYWLLNELEKLIPMAPNVWLPNKPPPDTPPNVWLPSKPLPSEKKPKVWLPSKPLPSEKTPKVWLPSEPPSEEFPNTWLPNEPPPDMPPNDWLPIGTPLDALPNPWLSKPFCALSGTGNNRAAPNASANAKVLIDLLFLFIDYVISFCGRKNIKSTCTRVSIDK